MSAPLGRALAVAAASAASLLPGASAFVRSPSALQDDAEGFLGFAAEQHDEVQGSSGALDLDSSIGGPSASASGGGALPEGAWALSRLAPGVAVGETTALGAVADGAGGFVLKPMAGGGSEALAWGDFADSLAELGWSGLSMHISPDAGSGDGAKMYAAGLVEGFLTAKRIKEFSHNSRALVEMSPENRENLPSLERALVKMVSELAGPSRDFEAQPAGAFDAQARLGLLQTWGVRDGYQLAIRSSGDAGPLADAKPLSMSDMFILNSDGVIDELLSKYGAPGGGDSFVQQSANRSILRGHSALRGGAPPSKPAPAVRSGQGRRPFAGHCTAFARLNEDRSELFFGHTTWEGFSEMTRIWKVYDFPLQGVTAKTMSFSSYPGCVSSTDDYYLMDSGLAITETTLSIPQQQEYPAGGRAPDFLRIMATNRLASTAEEWVKFMADSATGTYSSQWLVLDYKKFTPGSSLPDGTFYILEQAPGVSHFEDETATLEKAGYWAGFDRAFFDDIRERTGDTAMVQRSRQGSAQAAIYSKDNTPRAQIARSTAKDVNSLSAMREEMTSNHGTQEPVGQPSLRVPRYAISARDDLKDTENIDPDGSPDGGVDAKVTSSCLFKQLTAQAISGPSHASLPAFRWTNEDGTETWPGYPHEGLPNVANFDWVRTGPASEGAVPVVSRLAGEDGLCA